jgi:hypothetical protein
VRIAAVGSEVRIAGVLRAYFSLASLQGWALVPPQQHGGFAAVQLTELHLDEMTVRDIVLHGNGRRLRFSDGGETVFELERDDALFTAPPRSIGTGRYLYVGGRRRPSPEAWMLR